MNTVAIWQTESTSSEDTERIGEKIGGALRGGEVIELMSDLGGGKTTFTRGLVRGAGSTDRVASPTFTLSRMYQAAGKRIYHFDFYRLSEAGLMHEELAEIVGDPEVVTVVEWAGLMHDVLPDNRLTVEIEYTPSGTRNLKLTAPEKLDYLVEAARE